MPCLGRRANLAPDPSSRQMLTRAAMGYAGHGPWISLFLLMSGSLALNTPGRRLTEMMPAGPPLGSAVNQMHLSEIDLHVERGSATYDPAPTGSNIV